MYASFHLSEFIHYQYLTRKKSAQEIGKVLIEKMDEILQKEKELKKDNNVSLGFFAAK